MKPYIKLFLALLVLLGCRSSQVRQEEVNKDLWQEAGQNVATRVEMFSAEEFARYTQRMGQKLEELENARTRNQAYGGAVCMSMAADAQPTLPYPAPQSPGTQAESTSASTPAATTESITNVQEVGVDEGGIVKVYRNFFIVLRRGRLFCIRIEQDGRPALEPVCQVDAYPEGFSQSGWYDEMLLYRNKIIVIGYNYTVEATQIGIFELRDDGNIKHLSTYFIDTNDYYSSRNYTGRLIGNKLVFYMPYYLFTYRDSKDQYRKTARLPQMRKWVRANELTPGQDILSPTRIYKPLQATINPTLHIIAMCNLDSENFDCSAYAILGPYSRNFYVSPQAIYLWVSPESGEDTYLQVSTQGQRRRQPSHVYRLALDDSGFKVLKAYGAPTDQFSFKEDPDGYFNVLLREAGGGDAMWNPEVNQGKMALLRTSLANFTSVPGEVNFTDYTAVPVPKGYNLQNKFIGAYLLYGTGSTWYEDPSNERSVYLKKYKTQAEAVKLELKHSVDRIEAMGSSAVVVGGEKNALLFSAVELGDENRVQDVYTIPQAVQGELRSHGFFYKDYDIDGVLGLPIRKQGQSYQHLFTESSEIVFLRFKSEKKFAQLGSLVSSPLSKQNDDCRFSCVDWYGNSRPIFYKNRIFALMGYEFVEGILGDADIKELRRINYFVRR